MAVAGIFVIVAAIIAIDVPFLLKEKLKGELWLFSILLLLGTSLSVAKALNIKIPNPLDWITAIYKPLYYVIEELLR
ncbi:hypothetical protein KFD70_09585 [Bacillus pfraonensis]|uniref:hypothetical protein n=1 Tax=Bacillus TaxID=1386 RepID=UPI002A50C6C8|nr:hypothetical protein [Bacillus pseudomycoides]